MASPFKNVDLTSQNLPATMPGVAGNGELSISFKWVKVKIDNKDAQKNGTFETRLTIRRQPKGDRQTASVNFISEQDAAEQYPFEFQHFKDTGEVPTSGTPLDELPGISRSQIDLLVLNGLRSVEDLVGVSPDLVAQLGITATKAQKVALAWSENSRNGADVVAAADVAARYEAENAELKRQLQAAIEASNAATAQLTVLQQAQGVTKTSGEPMQVVNDESAGLPTSIDEMPDVFSGGDGLGDAQEPLSMTDTDPDPMAIET